MAPFSACFYTLNFDCAHQYSSLALFITVEKLCKPFPDFREKRNKKNIQFQLLAKAFSLFCLACVGGSVVTYTRQGSCQWGVLFFCDITKGWDLEWHILAQKHTYFEKLRKQKKKIMDLNFSFNSHEPSGLPFTVMWQRMVGICGL